MSGNKKAMEFRNRNKKLAAMNEVAAEQDAAAALRQLAIMVIGLNKRIVDLEKSNRVMYPAALDGEYRSHAIARVLSRLNIGVTEKLVEEAMKEMYVEDFEKGDPNDDLLRALEPAQGEAKEGMFAVLNLKMFKAGKELPEGEVVRRKIELGKLEVFPELDALVVGMKTGETKRVPFVIGNDSDEMEITLLKLRQKKVTKEEPNAEATAQPSS